jgi:DNA-methyltransferase (dcm)
LWGLKGKIKRMTALFKAIDLFCGCGGLTLGLKQAGFNVLAGIEVEPQIARTYRENHPDVSVFNENILNVNPQTLLDDFSLKTGELDLLAGCPPCQGFSSIKRLNKYSKMDDVRNELIFEFLRFAEVMLPKAIMLENVAGLQQYIGFTDFVSRLEKLGYNPKYQILNVADFGVPQRRKRLICLAGRIDSIPFAPPLYTKSTVRSTIEHLSVPGDSGDPLHDIPTSHSATVLERIASIPKDGGSRDSLPPKLVLDCHKKRTGFKDIYGRMKWDNVSPTITCGCFNPSKGRFLHPEQDRAITLREAALLQGFPESYKFPINKTLAATMIGNALPPPFIKLHSVSVMQYLERNYK